MSGLTLLQSPDGAPDLADGRVHVWRANLDDPGCELEALVEALTPAERRRAGRMSTGPVRRRWATARALTRVLLGACVGREPGELAWSYGACGKPRLDEACAPADVQFNMSHSGAVALFAVASGRDIGVDVEQLRPRHRLDRLTERCLSDYEADRLRRLPPQERLRAFYACWTRKEAFVKARGDGLSLPFRAFDVTVDAYSPPRLLRTAWDPCEADRWFLEDLPTDPTCVAAIAARRPMVRTQLHELTFSSE